MATVNLDRGVFNDPRYKILGRLLGITKWDAIARMAMVWDFCQETGAYVLSIEKLNALHDDVNEKLTTPTRKQNRKLNIAERAATSFAEAVITAGLGRKRRSGVYVRGTKGRIEWLEKKRLAARKNGKLGGRPRKPKENRSDNQDRLQAVTTSSSASASASASAQSQKEHSTSAAKAPPRSKKIFGPDSEPYSLAVALFDAIRGNDPNAREPQIHLWAKDFDRLIRIDKREPEEIRRLIAWCHADSFWRSIVLSASSFRDKYAQIRLKAESRERGDPPALPQYVRPM